MTARRWTLTALDMPVLAGWAKLGEVEVFTVVGPAGRWLLRPAIVLLDKEYLTAGAAFLVRLGVAPDKREVWVWGRVVAPLDRESWQYAAADTPEAAIAGLDRELDGPIDRAALLAVARCLPVRR